MSNRCGSCEKFVSLEAGTPEVPSLDVSADAYGLAVALEVRLVRVCAECGEEMREVSHEETVTLRLADLLQDNPEARALFVSIDEQAGTGDWKAGVEFEAEETDTEGAEEGTRRNAEIVGRITVRVRAFLDAYDELADDLEVTLWEDIIECREPLSSMEEVC